MNAKIAAMATPKRMLVGGRMMTVFLTDYEPSSDSYYGEAHTNRSIDVGDADKAPLVRKVTGARPYPTLDRPDYSFQFVELGEDEQPLLDIAIGNLPSNRAPEAQPAPPIETPGGNVFDPADTNKDGIVTKEEAKALKRLNKQ